MGFVSPLRWSGGPPRRALTARRGWPERAGLLHRGEGQVPPVVVRVARALDVLGLQDRRLVPQERDGGRLGGDLLVDVRPRLEALVALERRGLVHGLVDLR